MLLVRQRCRLRDAHPAIFRASTEWLRFAARKSYLPVGLNATLRSVANSGRRQELFSCPSGDGVSPDGHALTVYKVQTVKKRLRMGGRIFGCLRATYRSVEMVAQSVLAQSWPQNPAEFGVIGCELIPEDIEICTWA